ncbi:two component response regulator [Gluconacetobacter johannae DSM 13595]|uniref:ANTAR domain-containing protein n=1 Tax=Gluconacetobacter johannae TaxID=112140 RepID=A0A7W4P3T6_9PROT|nr:ANTAR domain-containing protein [Gluconacetobacter johannae]MBB2174373.1 ANTAR domain-containing protein [Gluconacetobacter johannae]GBQ85116.1 two component response regulator [Gluconacetobacter johannae DSM 13595]
MAGPSRANTPGPVPAIRVLLADENPSRAGALSDTLRADSSLVVIAADPGMPLMDAVRHHTPDIVLVDMSRADRDALDSVRALSGAGLEHPVALFVDEDDQQLMEAAFEAGICSYNVVDTPPRDVKPLLRAAIALYARFQQTQNELQAARKTISDRQTIDQAKRLFMQNEGCGEGEAYRWFRKRAMETARRIPDIAAEYLSRHRKDDTR